MPDPDYSNCPSCPEIKKKVDRIDRALLGKDGTGLNDGVIHRILQRQGQESHDRCNHHYDGQSEQEDWRHLCKL